MITLLMWTSCSHIKASKCNLCSIVNHLAVFDEVLPRLSCGRANNGTASSGQWKSLHLYVSKHCKVNNGQCCSCRTLSRLQSLQAQRRLNNVWVPMQWRRMEFVANLERFLEATGGGGEPPWWLLWVPLPQVFVICAQHNCIEFNSNAVGQHSMLILCCA